MFRSLLLAALVALPLAALAQGEADPEAGAPDPLAAFYDAVALGSVEDMETLLKADPALATKRDGFGFQAIHMLDYEGFDAKLKLLIADGADINAQNDDGVGLIHILVDPQFLPAVLAAGADINLRDKAGETPLMLFVQEPEGADMVAALIDAKADLTLRDAKGRTALAIARGTPDNDAVVALLTAAGAPD